MHRLVVHDFAAGRTSVEAVVAQLQRRRNGVAIPVEPIASSADSDQFERAVAEIEQAAAALRRSEPALEPWRPDSATHGETRTNLSVWVLVGGIWISAILMLCIVASAIRYLLY